MTVALLCGAGVGLGLLAVVRGLFPPRPPLAVALARLQVGAAPPRPLTTPPPPGEAGGVAVGLVGVPLARLARRLGLAPRWLARDLAVLERPLERHLAEKVTLALAVGGFLTPDLGIHADAARRRRDLRYALGSFLDLTVITLAGGSGVEGALTDAASVGHGFTATQLRRALAAARLRREPPWAALGRLGQELGVGELVELAASMELAGTEGAKVRASLAAKAASVRAHQLADAETQAQAATERMSLPVVLLFAGFLVFIGFPAVIRVLTGI